MKTHALIFGLACAWASMGFAVNEPLPQATLAVRFDETKWRVTAREEKRGADQIKLSLANDSEQKSVMVVIPRVGERVKSLSELADRFSLYVDDSPAPKRANVNFLGREAMLLRGITARANAADNRQRAIVVFFAGGEEWGIIFSGPAESDPGLQDILGLVGPLK